MKNGYNFEFYEVPPPGYSAIYLLSFKTADTGKIFQCYVGKTDGSPEARHGQRIVAAYYESSDAYNIPVHKLLRSIGSENIKKEVVAVVKTEMASSVEHLFEIALSNMSCNVQNIKNLSIDLSKVTLPKVLLKVEPETYRVLDSYKDDLEVIDTYGYDNFDLESAIESEEVFDGSLWIWSDKFEVPDNKDNLCLKDTKINAQKYSIIRNILKDYNIVNNSNEKEEIA